MKQKEATTFQQLLEAASPDHQAELRLVRSSRDAAMLAYERAPGKQSKADWDASRDAHDETVQRLTRIYFPAEAPESERFRSRLKALEWLQDQGYKVGRSKFYEDCSAGNPAVHRDGTVSRWQVLQYGQQLEARRKAAVSSEQFDEADLRRKLAEADIAEMKAETMRREQDQRWLHRDEAYETAAAIFSELLARIRHHFHRGASELIHLAGGDQNRMPEVFEHCLQLINQGADEMATAGEIAGSFEGDRK